MSGRLELARGLLATWLGPDRPGLFRVHDGALFELDRDSWSAFEVLHRGGDPGPAGRDLAGEGERLGLLVEPGTGIGPFPSLPPQESTPLRYLNLQITHRCPLRCRHCYHGAALGSGRDLDLGLVFAALGEFAAMGGLAFTVSGGEPTSHPGFWELNARLPELGRRAILATSGLGVAPARAAALEFHLVRLSLDGTQAGHETLRGRGSFAPALRFAAAVREAGIPLEVSTMLHAGNRHELEALEALVHDELRARAWRVGIPFGRGAWREAEPRLGLPPAEAAALRARFPGYGPSAYVSDARATCDAELLTVDADGSVGSCAMLPAAFEDSLLSQPLAQIHRRRVAALAGLPSGSLACRARCAQEPEPAVPPAAV